MTAPSIDLNADLGEDPAAAADGRDAAVLAWVTSANIACGGHAGDEATMRATVRACLARGVAVGAHPGYPDRARFGRADLAMPAAQVEATVAAQVAALAAIARAEGATLAHAKPHGALYHAAMRRTDLAAAVARGAARGAEGLVLVGQADAPGLEVWRAMGCAVAGEAFADRRYEADGTLRARSLPGALIEDPAEAAAQAVAIARRVGVRTADGTLLPLAAETLCVHGDTPGADRVARAVREALESAGFRVAPLRG